MRYFRLKDFDWPDDAEGPKRLC